MIEHKNIKINSNLFNFINEKIQQSGFEEKIPAGIVLTGGTSKMEGVIELAESIFQTSVRLGVPNKFQGMENILQNPIYATSIGLVHMAICRKKKISPLKVIKALFQNF